MRPNESTQWIFLRGLVRESAHWDKFPQLFERTIPGSSVRLMDLPGNGRHHLHASPTSLSEATNFLREELERTNSGRVFLFSISMGSMVALDWANRFPEEVLGVVLINTSLKGFSPIYERLRFDAWGKVLRLLCEKSVEVREKKILELTANSAVTQDPSVVQARVLAYQKHPVKKSNVLRQLLAAATFQPPSQCPKVPMLLLSSEQDRLTHSNCGEALARQWNIPRKVHPTAGHDLPLDDPNWTIDQTKAWLQSFRARRDEEKKSSD